MYCLCDHETNKRTHERNHATRPALPCPALFASQVGENYLAKNDKRNKWFYFPNLTKSEAVLIKCWDTHGKDFADGDASKTIPATFSYHSAFEIDAPESAPARRSIEIRTLAFLPTPRSAHRSEQPATALPLQLHPHVLLCWAATALPFFCNAFGAM